MDKDMTRFMWRLASSSERSSSLTPELCLNADSEVHVPGEYAYLEQWFRMLRPGRQLL